MGWGAAFLWVAERLIFQGSDLLIWQGFVGVIKGVKGDFRFSGYHPKDSLSYHYKTLKGEKGDLLFQYLFLSEKISNHFLV